MAKRTDAPLYGISPDGLFVVDCERTIPRVCLKCASTKHVVRREVRGPTSGAAVGAVVGVVSVGVVSATRLSTATLLGALLGSGLIAWVVHLATARVRLRLPLCESCNAAWSAGVRYSIGILAGWGVLVATLVPMRFFTLFLAVGTALLLVVVTLSATVAIVKLTTRYVGLRRVVGTRAHLSRVNAAVPSAIRQRRAERKAKRTRDRVREPGA
ncbi:MAG: hypothetical protein K8H88_26110 [Sandaracinaceae bacterium]|nr:hypothetical protein [Sandaracinaceae bacterium]